MLQQEIQVESLTMELREVFWRTAKIFFQLALLITFLFYFGMPAIEKYSRKGVMVMVVQQEGCDAGGPHEEHEWDPHPRHHSFCLE